MSLYQNISGQNTSSGKSPNERLFIGTPINPPLYDLFVDFRHTMTASELPSQSIRWIDPECWHITWLFLGNVHKSHIPEYCQAIESTAMACAAFEACLMDIELWPNPKHPRLVVGRLANHTSFQHVFAQVCRAFPAHPPDKAFIPHITLGRIKAPKNPFPPGVGSSSASIKISQEGTCKIDCLHLYTSALTPKGAVYQSISKAVFADNIQFTPLCQDI